MAFDTAAPTLAQADGFTLGHHCLEGIGQYEHDLEDHFHQLSAGPDSMAEVVAGRLGFDEDEGLSLAKAHGRADGPDQGPQAWYLQAP
jgi:hypothetical protein